MFADRRLRHRLLPKVVVLLCIPLVYELLVVTAFFNLAEVIDKERVRRRLINNTCILGLDLINQQLQGSKHCLEILLTREKIDSKELDGNSLVGLDRSWNLFLDAANEADINTTSLQFAFLKYRMNFLKARYNTSNTLSLDDLKLTAGVMDSITEMVHVSENFLNQRLIEIEENDSNENALYRSIIAVLVLGLIVSVCLAYGLTIFLGKLIVQRMEVVSENTARFKENEELLPALKGDDEIARIDREFRRMAKEFVETSRKYNALTDNSVAVICNVDEELTFTRLSKASAELFDTSNEELKNTSVLSQVREENVDELFEAFNTAKENSALVSVEVTTKSGRVGLFSIKWIPDDGNFHSIIHDITSRKRMEKSRQEMLSIVSHDLRSPLTTIQLALDSVVSNKSSGISRKARQDLLEVSETVNGAVVLINDLLDLVKLEADTKTGSLSIADVEQIKSIIKESSEQSEISSRILDKVADRSLKLVLNNSSLERILNGCFHSLDCWSKNHDLETIVSLRNSGNFLEIRLELESTLKQENWNVGDKSKLSSGEVTKLLFSFLASSMFGTFSTGSSGAGLPWYIINVQIAELNSS